MEGYYDASRRHIAVIILKLGSSPVSEAAPSPYRIIATSCCYCSCQRRTDRLRRTVNWNGDDQSDLAFPVGKVGETSQRPTAAPVDSYNLCCHYLPIDLFLRIRK